MTEIYRHAPGAERAAIVQILQKARWDYLELLWVSAAGGGSKKLTSTHYE